MSQLIPIRRLVLGAALAGATIGAAPSLASAQSTCTLDQTTHRANVIDGSGSAPLRVVRSGKFIEVEDGSGPLIGCGGTTTFATNLNTDRVIVQGTAGSSSTDGYVIDHSQGALAPGLTAETDGTSEIEVQIRQPSGIPAHLTHIGTGAAETIRVVGDNGIAVGNDDDTDENIFNPNGGAYRASGITVDGGASADFISGRGITGSFAGPSTVPLALFGGDNNDTVVDGLSAGDTVSGDGGADTLFTLDGRGDSVHGGAGSDSATLDTSDSPSSDIEFLTFGTVGRLHLAPRIVKTRASKWSNVTMTWTHPKSWRDLRAVYVGLFRGAKQVGMVNVRPRGERLTTSGAVQIMTNASRVRHSGKTVTARLQLRVAPSLAGQDLRIGVTATDRHGRSQLVPDAGTLRVAR